MADKSEQIEENLVKKTCRELGITQKELAEKIGVSRVTINDWANERTPIPLWGNNLIFYLKENRELIKFKTTIKNLLLGDRNIILSL
jgi:transcriptional regulator with XRE-family HTH domain